LSVKTVTTSFFTSVGHHLYVLLVTDISTFHMLEMAHMLRTHCLTIYETLPLAFQFFDSKSHLYDDYYRTERIGGYPTITRYANLCLFT